MTIPAAPNKLVPLALPLGFIAVGVLELAAGTFLLASHPQALQAYRHPVLLAAAHLLLLGFGVGVLMGALHQLVPVILEVPLARPAWGYPVLALWAIGTPLQAIGFLEAQSSWVALGGGLSLLGIWGFALHMLLTYRQADRWNPVATALAWVTFYLALTPLLGMLQALTLRYGFYDPDRLAWHALAGLVGVFLLSILGVGHKLVAMFTLSHGTDEGVLGLELWVLNLGLLGLALGQPMGLGLLALGLALAFYDTWCILRHRVRRALDVGVRHYLAGLGFLPLSLGALLAGEPLRAGLWFGLGFLGLVVSGMLYKIAPFLVWTQRYAPRVGQKPVPALKAMLPERAANAAGLLLGLGALLAPFWPPALWLCVAGALLCAYALEEVIRS
ncbi:MAG: hypothetical protein C4327_07205 [Meiothermus sp.]